MIVIFFDLEIGNIKNANNNAKPKCIALAGKPLNIPKSNMNGNVTVGLLTNAAISSFKKPPHLNYKQREIILKNLRLVNKVIPQKTLDYRPNLIKFKPDFVVHGDDWRKGPQKETRRQVILTLKKWSGKLVEVPYTKKISSTLLKKRIIKKTNIK